jgi:glycosyltransferase involved in cell wall biosynthesis
MSLRVVHVLDSLRLGGTETQVVALVRALAGEGVASHVVYSHSGPLTPQLQAADVTTERLHMPGLSHPAISLFILQLARTFRRRRADVVQSYGFYRNFPAAVAGRLAGVRAIVAGRRGFGTHLTPAQRRVDRLAYRLAHRTVVNAEALRARLIEHEGVRPGAVAVIPNSVAERGPITPARDPIVGMVANFRPPKDHATFLSAAARVMETVPTAEFHLVGAGAGEPQARRLAEELGLAARTRFLGALEPDQVWAAANRFAVAVLSSRSEALPNTVLEAMAAARPVVATAVGDVPALVRNGVTGFVVPPGDAVALAAAIAALLKDPARAAALGAAGRAHVLAAHGPTRMAHAFLDLYRTLGVAA